MGKKRSILSPTYVDLIIPTYNALKELGGSGTNTEICEKVIELLELPDEVIDESHLGNINQTELEYQLAWARTYMKNFGIIENSARSVWSITPQFRNELNATAKEIVANMNKYRKRNANKIEEDVIESVDDNPDDNEYPEEVKPWKVKLSEVLMNMDPYGFERLTQRLLRECGFTEVKVTKKSGDGGIDGTGKLRINGIFSFTVAFQCKRYKGSVGSAEIRDFRGSLTTDIEKGVFITTGTFSKAAKEEASNHGKKQIDLIDGEEFINKLAEYGIGVREVKTYEVNEQFFNTI